jgi:hypothetical protein
MSVCEVNEGGKSFAYCLNVSVYEGACVAGWEKFFHLENVRISLLPAPLDRNEKVREIYHNISPCEHTNS